MEKIRHNIPDISLYIAGFGVMTGPIWAGLVLLQYHHPFLALATLVISEW